MRAASPLKTSIARRFAAASDRYDSASPIQRESAAALAALLTERDWPPAPRILEIGCGTGHLTQALYPHFPGAFWIASDIAPAMAARLRDRWPSDSVPPSLLAMDGETPALSGAFDLILGNLVVQWFLDPAESLARLAGFLAPGGCLAFATLGRETLREWKAAHRALGLAASAWDYPDFEGWRRICPPALRLVAGGTHPAIAHHEDARGFIDSLRAIGADQPGPEKPRAKPGDLRRVMAALDRQKPIPMTYEIVTMLLVKSA